MKKPKIIFNKSAAPFILTIFDCSINEQGVIINKQGEPVLCPEGEELTLKTFGGVKRSDCGKPMFLKNDLLTAIKLVENQY